MKLYDWVSLNSHLFLRVNDPSKQGEQYELPLFGTDFFYYLWLVEPRTQWIRREFTVGIVQACGLKKATIENDLTFFFLFFFFKKRKGLDLLTRNSAKRKKKMTNIKNQSLELEGMTVEYCWKKLLDYI